MCFPYIIASAYCGANDPEGPKISSILRLGESCLTQLSRYKKSATNKFLHLMKLFPFLFLKQDSLLEH